MSEQSKADHLYKGEETQLESALTDGGGIAPSTAITKPRGSWMLHLFRFG